MAVNGGAAGADIVCQLQALSTTIVIATTNKPHLLFLFLLQDLWKSQYIERVSNGPIEAAA